MSKKNTIALEKIEEVGMEFSGITSLATKADNLTGCDLSVGSMVKIWNEFVEEIENRIFRIRELIK